MRLTMLGTGHAMVTNCYNTCFTIERNGEHFLVDAGGGNMILSRLEKAEIDWRSIHDIFVTHKHADHIIGVIWMIRKVGQSMCRGEYSEKVTIYSHDKVIYALREMVKLLLPSKIGRLIDGQIKLAEVTDGENMEILGKKTTFFDIQSEKEKQFGFTMEYAKDKRLTCLGDEPFHLCNEQYVKGSEWLLHEAFCLYRDRETFHPYEKKHSTVREACETAQKYAIPKLLLYHTEDKSIKSRKNLYEAEGKNYFTGKLYIPYDLEQIDL